MTVKQNIIPMFFMVFSMLAQYLPPFHQSLNNNKRPNNKNDVITDLGGEGDFPMFRYGILKTLTSSQALRLSQALKPFTPIRIARHPHISYHSGRLGNALTGIIAPSAASTGIIAS